MFENKRFLVNAYGLGENLLPLVHSEEQIGNKIFFRRLKIKAGEELVSTPVISGNSFRGAWRDLAAIHTVQSLGVESLSKDLFGIFFSGGSLEEKASEKEKRAKAAFAARLYTLFPALRLLGFSLGSSMYPSRLGVDFAVPLVVETRGYALAAYPKLACPTTAVEAGDITAVTMMTRKDDESKSVLLDLNLLEVSESQKKPSPTQMIFHVEYIVPNTPFVHGFRSIYPFTPLEIGALLKVLELSTDRSYGGMGSKGFGRMRWTYTVETFDKPGGVDPNPKTLTIGDGAVFDPALAKYKEMYEVYMAELRVTLQADKDFAKILRLQ